MVVSPSDVFLFFLKRPIILEINSNSKFLKKVRSAKRIKRSVMVSIIIISF